MALSSEGLAATWADVDDSYGSDAGLCVTQHPGARDLEPRPDHKLTPHPADAAVPLLVEPRRYRTGGPVLSIGIGPSATVVVSSQPETLRAAVYRDYELD
jgi:hypothetical protein